MDNNIFFKKTLVQILSSFEPYIAEFIYGFNQITIGTFKNVEYFDKDHFTNLHNEIEETYKSVEGIDIKKPELFINHYQKDMQRGLLKKGISINGKYVSRAWVKLYELYFETDYFANLGKSVLNIIPNKKAFYMS